MWINWPTRYLCMDLLLFSQVVCMLNMCVCVCVCICMWLFLYVLTKVSVCCNHRQGSRIEIEQPDWHGGTDSGRHGILGVTELHSPRLGGAERPRRWQQHCQNSWLWPGTSHQGGCSMCGGTPGSLLFVPLVSFFIYFLRVEFYH